MKKISILLLAVLCAAHVYGQATKEATVHVINRVNEVPGWFLQPPAGEYAGVSLPEAAVDNEDLAKQQAVYVALLSCMAQHHITGTLESLITVKPGHSESVRKLMLSLPDKYQISRIAKNKYGEVFVALRVVSENAGDRIRIKFEDFFQLTNDEVSNKHSTLILLDKILPFSFYFTMKEHGNINEYEYDSNTLPIEGSMKNENMTTVFRIDNNYAYKSTGSSSINQVKRDNGEVEILEWLSAQSLQTSLGATYLMSLLTLLSDDAYWLFENTEREATPIKSIIIDNNTLYMSKYNFSNK
ncbi:MAG: hypothetical protein LBN98_05755 [Prevotellaceae bacterium]|nr:hypothetical protein [Prevotellaceae bacterium]